MRVLHVADRLSDRGGAWTWLLGVLDGLAADHGQRLVVGEDEGGARVPCEVVVRPGLEARTGVAVPLDDLARAADVVHLHNVTNPDVLEWAARLPRAVLTVQDHRFFCPARGKWTLAGEACRRPMLRELCAECFEDTAHFGIVHRLTERRLAAARRLRTTVLSRYMREELVAVGAPLARVHVVPPFVYGLGAVDAHPPAGPPCVLFAGRLTETKGVWDAVEAWRRSGVELPLVVAGTGPLRHDLERAAAASHGPALEVLGWVDRERLAGLYRRARALLLPSRWQEPFGIVGLEAMAFGVPVAAWESGAVAEWHPGPGLVRWGDVDGLARALARAVSRRVHLPPRFERDEAIGRLLALYARL
jgi:glycosyltransferase involved in cell wall biosynthesis